MKRINIMAGGLLLPLLAMASVTTPPSNVKFYGGMYGLKISPNGKYIGNMAGDASVFVRETEDLWDYWGTFLGLGNCVANNGIAVGDANDNAVILMNGRIIRPEALSSYLFCDLNGITADGTRLCGYFSNTKGSGPSLVPFVADVDENGNVLTPVVLPYPELDFFRAAPQYVTTIWISNDGKTVLGNVTDWRGMFEVPIYYKQDDAGEWKYYLPTEPMFNPTGIDIPDNPWLTEPKYPEPEDVMSPLAREAYQNKYDEWLANGCIGEMPDYTQYMTQEEYEEYKAAVEHYNNWYYEAEPSINEYVKIYREVLKTTPSFSGNDVALHPDGDYFYTNGTRLDENDDRAHSVLYKIYTNDQPMEELVAPSGTYPSQVLTDGTLIMSRGMMATPDSYILFPGAEKFVRLEEYLQPYYPEVSEWIELNLAGGNGLVSMSDDKSVIVGALIPSQFTDYDFDDPNAWYYNTYIISNDISGVEAIEDTLENETYTVYNLQGVKVLETKNASDIHGLAKGIYIVNGKKVVL